MLIRYYDVYEKLSLKLMSGQKLTDKEWRMMDKLEEWICNDV